MTTSTRFDLPHAAVAALCQRRHIRKLSLFGSVLRDDFGPDSDIDVLVEFEEGHVPGFGFVAVQQELSELVGRPVDLVTPKGLNRRIREKVLAQAKVEYAGGGVGQRADW